MNRPYLVMVNNVLWDRKLTRAGAMKTIEMLIGRGLKAVLAYSLDNETGGN